MSVLGYQRTADKYPTTVPQELKKEKSKTLRMLLISVSIRDGVFQQVAASVPEENTASFSRFLYL
jgi:hypothetical protein